MSQQEQRVFNGRYELTRHIARGGMAEVWQAHDLHLDRPVALKILFPELSVDPTFVERFRREAQAAANLGHPNIVSIYDWGVENGTYFIVMEYIDGHSLSAVIRAEGRLLPDRAASIAADIGAALAYSHKHGVVHRDVKPANVLIDSSGHVKVTDFGIARAKNTTENLTQTGAVMGTATYFSPEQAQGVTVDARSDVYSLGVVLYEMVTGRPPFTGDNPMAIAYKHVKEPVVPPSQIEGTIPPAFEAVILRALVKDPDQRYSSADELRADLIRYRQGRPVQAVALGRNVPQVPPTDAPPPTVGATRVQERYPTVAEPSGTRAVALPQVEYDEPPRRTGAYIVLLVVMLTALGVLLTLLYREFSTSGSDKSATAVVPADLIGKSFDDAATQLTGLGFTGQIIRKDVQNQDQTPGIVFDVDPKPGTKADKTAPITLSVSQGAPPVAVADVRNKTEDDARSALEGSAFIVNVTRQTSDTVPAGKVISQSPLGNTQAPKGSTVNLVVSTGKNAVTVPEESGKSVTDAAADLGANKLKVATIKEPSSTVAKDTVIRTNPGAGTQVAEGTTVTLVVSTGPEPTTTSTTAVPQVAVPSVVLMTQADATKTLKDAGFKVKVDNVIVFAPKDDGVVQDQSPNGGTSAPKGSTVTITVGKLGP